MFEIINAIFIALLVIHNDVETTCPNPIKTCERGKISFYLYKELSQPYEEIILNDEDSIKKAPFIPKADFKMLIHGYTGCKDRPPAMAQIRNEYLKLKKYNILVVDWGPLAVRDCYFDTAFPSIPLVGRCCAEFVNSILRYRPEIKEDQFHLVAWSMGAQTCAQFANYFKPKLVKRITGLDPAFPKFEPPFTAPHNILNREHAKFVDVLHSNVGQYGVIYSKATYDIYLNNGKFQPGCKLKPGCDLSNVSCNHRRAPEVFAESINSKTKFMARKCEHNSVFILFGKCDGDSKTQIEVGEYCLPPTKEEDEGTYQLLTNDHPPYAKGPDT